MNLTIFDFVLLLIVAGVCGMIAQAVSGYMRGGLLWSILLGFIGALFGVWIAHGLDLPPVFTLHTRSGTFPVFWAVIGALLFLILLGMFRRQYYYRRWWW
jgi:uncharacterized membrane protein YeaQ/YmgE (transglycosylase-associated protein family)